MIEGSWGVLVIAKPKPDAMCKTSWAQASPAAEPPPPPGGRIITGDNRGIG